MTGEWPSADEVAGIGGPVRPVSDGGFEYTEADLEAAIDGLAPATRDRIRLVLDPDETLREWARAAVAMADLPVSFDDPIETIQAAVWHRFRTEVDPDHEQRAKVPIGLPAETWGHLKARALARYQRRDDREDTEWFRTRSPEDILADIVSEYVTFDPVILVDGEPKSAADVFPTDALKDSADEGEP